MVYLLHFCGLKHQNNHDISIGIEICYTRSTAYFVIFMESMIINKIWRHIWSFMQYIKSQYVRMNAWKFEVSFLKSKAMVGMQNRLNLFGTPCGSHKNKHRYGTFSLSVSLSNINTLNMHTYSLSLSHIHIHTHIHIRKHTNHIHTNITQLHICLYLQQLFDIVPHSHKHKNTHIHTQTHKHTHTHTHT